MTPSLRIVSRALVAGVCIVMLAACAGRAVRPAAPAVSVAAAEQVQRARLDVLQAHPRWALQGRVALSNGRNGGSGRIDWQQDHFAYTVALSAPITRQSWRLSGDDHSARMEGLETGPRSGPDARRLLLETTGWTIPVSALASWVRGAPDGTMPPAVVEYGADGRLAQLRQSGWRIDYSHWQVEPGLGIELPTRLDASQGDAKVRLVIDQWLDGNGTP
jgi:outer membrane lipoprotein LolB